MAKVIDLTSKLSMERPVIKLAEGIEFEVNDDHKAVLLVQQGLETKTEAEAFTFVFKSLLGDEALAKIEELGLSFSAMKTLFIAVMASASGEEFEVLEERFQQSTK